MSLGFLLVEDYPRVEKAIDKVFYADRLLPEYVFKKKYEFTLLADFAWLQHPDIVNLVNDRRFCNADEKILLSVLDPDPIAYFNRNFNKINSFVFSSFIEENEYMDLLCLNPGNEADAIQYRADTIVWIPDNGRWAIWGERDREIAVIGFDDPAQADFLLNEDGYWIDAETAIREDFARAPYPDEKAPEDFARALIENYGSRQDLERKLKEVGITLKPGTWQD